MLDIKTDATEIRLDPAPTEKFLELSDGRIHYLDWGGDGMAAHFLHGNGFCAGTYAPFIKFFFGRFRRRLNSLIADYELHTISDAGHLIPMEKPERCARLIQDFVYRRILAVN